MSNPTSRQSRFGPFLFGLSGTPSTSTQLQFPSKCVRLKRTCQSTTHPNSLPRTSQRFASTGSTAFVFISLGHFRPIRFGLIFINTRMYASPSLYGTHLCTCNIFFRPVGCVVCARELCSVRCAHPTAAEDSETDDHKGEDR